MPAQTASVGAQFAPLGARTRPCLVAVLGAPGAGKSTLSAGLITGRGARVCRIRELAQTYRDITGTTGAVRDRLGWLPERAVRQLLAAAVADGRIGGPGLTVLEGFPGSTEQARLLHHLGLSLTADVRIVELDVPGPVLLARTRARRVCRGCEPGARGDPHRPARDDQTRPGRCAACSTRLTRRSGDEPVTLAARTDRYRRRLPGIRRVAEGLTIPYRVVDGETEPHVCLAAVLAFLDPNVPRDRLPAAGRRIVSAR